MHLLETLEPDDSETKLQARNDSLDCNSLSKCESSSIATRDSSKMNSAVRCFNIHFFFPLQEKKKKNKSGDDLILK